MKNVEKESRGGRRARISIALTATLIASFAAAAADGRIPIGTVPYTISTPGSYYLTADLTYGATGPAITISASNVNLDLNGHLLAETSTANGSTCITADGYTNLKVFNGNISGGSTALALWDTPAGLVTVEDLSISGSTQNAINIVGVSPGPVVQVTNNRISFSGVPGAGYGVSISSAAGGMVAHNVVLGQSKTVGVGLSINNVESLTLEDNQTNSLYIGLYILGDSGISVRTNNLSFNEYGMWVASSSAVDIEENVTAGNTSYGIYFNPGIASYLYRNNVSQGNGTNYAVSGGTNGGGNY